MVKAPVKIHEMDILKLPETYSDISTGTQMLGGEGELYETIACAFHKDVQYTDDKPPVLVPGTGSGFVQSCEACRVTIKDTLEHIVRVKQSRKS